MVNAFHSKMTKGPRPVGKGSEPSMKEKPGFSTGVPGKKQPKDRSNGVPRAKIHPASEGL